MGVSSLARVAVSVVLQDKQKDHFPLLFLFGGVPNKGDTLFASICPLEADNSNGQECFAACLYTCYDLIRPGASKVWGMAPLMEVASGVRV